MKRFRTNSRDAAGILVVAATMTFAGCGSAEDPADDDGKSGPGSDQPTPVGEGTMSFAISNAAYSTDDGAYESSVLQTCRKDLTTGLLTVTLGDATNSMDVRIKDFRTAPATYSCAQAANNATAQDSIGDRYQSCMVETRATSADAEGASGYSMHRTSAGVPLFSYAGTCTVAITEIGERVRGDVNCSGMVQTTLEGATRNPVDTAVSADVAGSFVCDLLKQ